MNVSISVLFRAIPLVMGALCLAYGLDVRLAADDAGSRPAHVTAGTVLIALTAICFALFTTAATIIRQLIHRYSTVWKVVLPCAGYVVALATVVWGVVIAAGRSTEHHTIGPVVVGIGLVATCVSTVATASTAFTRIPANSARPADAGPPDGAYSAAVGWALGAVPAACAVAAIGYAAALLAEAGADDVGGHVLLGLGMICASLVALVLSIVRQVRNTFTGRERYWWTWWVAAMGTVNLVWGLVVLLGTDWPARYAPGFVLIGLGLICFSILSKVLLLALVWRQSFPLASRIPLIPVVTALTCLFLAAFVFEAAVVSPGFFVPARVLVGLGAVCFTLYSIVSILEAGASSD
ncbi:DUF2776 family protein [Rhodococcus sp. X156]|uniref:DUF2776 family protein n=1 Tax=Rhodococcus sp. X156 TaxID=2499145 RepID=UPI000FDB96B0|nr:DUF2776 family protein [Rhodococcus sp. X156]